jgi:hypothetical protein
VEVDSLSEENIINNCAPTLAGIKTGSLFNAFYESRASLLRDIAHFNRLLSEKGLRLIPLRFSQTSALIYLYRPDKLKSDLKDPEASRILAESGYESRDGSKCISMLISRLRRDGDFPHEIGLFLSYPPEDVRGFIENRGKNAKAGGLWKVYGDVECAEALFKKYKRCTVSYRRAFERGKRLGDLALACK